MGISVEAAPARSDHPAQVSHSIAPPDTPADRSLPEGRLMDRHLAAIVSADIVGFTRLIGGSGARTIDAVLGLWHDTLAPLVAARNGRLVKQTGDGFLIEFSSATDALDCALEWQNRLNDGPGNRKGQLAFRIGINIGDVYTAGSDIYGEGVNIAARLEGICPPGAVCVSETVRAAADGDIEAVFSDLGDRRLKNVSRPVRAWLAERPRAGNFAATPALREVGPGEIRCCGAVDGVSLAYSVIGEGPPLVFAGSWMTHLEKDWEGPWGPYLAELSKGFELVRYDQRGNGMSDWEVDDICFERMVDDLGAVIDRQGHERVAVYGASQAASVAIAYAHRNPHRVSHLILQGGYARGRRCRGSEDDTAESIALVTLIRKGWGGTNPAFRQLMTSIFMPEASPEEAAWFNAFQSATAPAANAARFRELFDEVDVAHLLPEIDVPTLVMHSAGDTAAPVAEGRLIASRIPNARFVKLDSNNHILFENEPEFPRLVRAIREFLA